jgi:cysteine desulfurase/selenocysteine lyase
MKAVQDRDTQIKFGEAIRSEFPILSVSARGKKLVYLDNAATSQKPLAVIEALDEYWAEANSNVHRGVHFLSERATEGFEKARETVRRFLNAREASEVIFTKGCSEGINLVATSLGRFSLGMSSTGTRRGSNSKALPKIGKGDVILVSTMEHHSNIVPWQMLCEQTGALVKPIPINDAGEIDLDAFDALLRDNPVKVLAIVHISNSIGTVNPVKEMAKRAHAVGALVLVDGAQAGPHWLVDVQDIDADFYTLSCHKMYAPTGIGVLYGKRALLEALPAYQGGGSMIRTVSFEETTYAEIPAKFEPGTPNIAGVIGLGAAIEYVENLGSRIADRESLAKAMRAIHDHERLVAGKAEQLLADIAGVRLVGTARERAGIVSFVIEGVHPHDIGSVLDSEGIAIRTGHHCCMPLMKRFGVPATARASFAFYNTLDEVDALVAGVIKVKEMFT